MSENKYHGVVDRVTNDLAIILVDSIKKQFERGVEKLPKNIKEGSWLLLTLNDDQTEIIDATLDPAKQEQKHQTIQDKLNKVKAKSNKKSKLKKKNQ
ncbi:DUF3006 domain-containing protein [Shouchella sp. 1P09AA]|uniref:DUF3006 domain-containing protein n=1 Tax=unclassified Shouchella TaxID=2893065 RepID=UPI0039A354CB